MTIQPTAGTTALSDFARDVRDGLSRQPKALSSKYFYDEAGDKLFQRIMAMPEYYLTGCELEIFQTQRNDILRSLGEEPFELIELGAGDGLKTQVLLEHFLAEGVDFVYRPIDISGHVLDLLTDTLAGRWPALEVRPVQGDYFTALSRLSSDNGRRKVVLFLGSNIGNFDQKQAAGFLRRLRSHLSPCDFTFIGFDLKKDPAVIWPPITIRRASPRNSTSTCCGASTANWAATSTWTPFGTGKRITRSRGRPKATSSAPSRRTLP